MATVNQVGNSLTGSTGSGAFVGATTPTLVRPSAGNFISGYTTTVTAAATTTLTVSSTYQQFFTGTTTQTVAMPVTSTLTVGQSWLIGHLGSAAVVNFSIYDLVGGGERLSITPAGAATFSSSVDAVSFNATSTKRVKKAIKNKFI